MSSADRPPTEPPWEALEALAAGELTPAEARALESRIRSEQGWSDAYGQVREVERLLSNEPLLPVPLPLVRKVLAEVLPARRESPWTVLTRAAAAVLVFCASWLAFSGSVPALADIGPREEVSVDLPAVLPSLPAATITEVGLPAEGSTAAALALAVAGLLLITLGTWSSLRWHRRATGLKEIPS